MPRRYSEHVNYQYMKKVSPASAHKQTDYLSDYNNNPIATMSASYYPDDEYNPYRYGLVPLSERNIYRSYEVLSPEIIPTDRSVHLMPNAKDDISYGRLELEDETGSSAVDAVGGSGGGGIGSYSDKCTKHYTETNVTETEMSKNRFREMEIKEKKFEKVVKSGSTMVRSEKPAEYSYRTTVDTSIPKENKDYCAKSEHESIKQSGSKVPIDQIIVKSIRSRPPKEERSYEYATISKDQMYLNDSGQRPYRSSNGEQTKSRCKSLTRTIPVNVENGQRPQRTSRFEQNHEARNKFFSDWNSPKPSDTAKATQVPTSGQNVPVDVSSYTKIDNSKTNVSNENGKLEKNSFKPEPALVTNQNKTKAISMHYDDDKHYQSTSTKEKLFSKNFDEIFHSKLFDSPTRYSRRLDEQTSKRDTNVDSACERTVSKEIKDDQIKQDRDKDGKFESEKRTIWSYNPPPPPLSQQPSPTASRAEYHKPTTSSYWSGDKPYNTPERKQSKMLETNLETASPSKARFHEPTTKQSDRAYSPRERLVPIEKCLELEEPIPTSVRSYKCTKYMLNEVNH